MIDEINIEGCHFYKGSEKAGVKFQKELQILTKKRQKYLDVLGEET